LEIRFEDSSQCSFAANLRVAGAPGNLLVIVRYNADGTLDFSFGSSGKVSTSFAGIEYGMVIQADGKIVVMSY